MNGCHVLLHASTTLSRSHRKTEKKKLFQRDPLAVVDLPNHSQGLKIQGMYAYSLYFHVWTLLKSLPWGSQGMPWTQPENATWHGGNETVQIRRVVLDWKIRTTEGGHHKPIYPMILEKRFGARDDVFFSLIWGAIWNPRILQNHGAMVVLRYPIGAHRANICSVLISTSPWKPQNEYVVRCCHSSSKGRACEFTFIYIPILFDIVCNCHIFGQIIATSQDLGPQMVV